MSLASVPARGLAVPPGLFPLALLLLLLGAGPNFELSIVAIGVLVAGSILLWRPGESPVLFFAFGLGWLGSSVTSFYGNWLNVEAATFSPFSASVHEAILLSLVGLLSMAVGMRLGQGRAATGTSAGIMAAALSLPISRWFQIWLVGIAVSMGTGAASSLVPDALGQLLLGFSNQRWAFFFMLAYASFVQKERFFLGIAFAIELALGTGGYFSDFKTVFLVTMMAFIMSGARLSSQGNVFVASLAAILLLFGVVWTSVKGDFRTYIRGDIIGQNVTVGYADRMVKLFSLVADLDNEKLGEGFDQLIRRVSYVEFFGAVLYYVPQFESHSNGQILTDALIRPFTPRILFPEKTVIDDTARTNQYTGGLAGLDDTGTSISLGYIAENYIDFGLPGMFAGLLLIGLIYGSICRWLLAVFSPLLANAFATATLINVGSLDQSFTKVFGGLVATLIAAWVLGRLVVPIWLPQLSRGPR